MSSFRSLLAAVTMLLASEGALATACLGPSPFDDILQSDPICSNAEWLKNRGVTLGCTSNLYCPTDPVSRAQMALFMNRLATAIVPSIGRTSDSSLSNVDLDVDSFHCVTPQYVVTDFPRTLVLNGHFSALTTGAAAYAVTIYYNTTGSSTDFTIPTSSLHERVGTTAATWTTASTSAFVDLDVGTTYRFAIRVAGLIGNTGDLDTWRCNLLQTLHPRERNSILP